MESCASAHYSGRVFRDKGFTVKLIAPQFVKPFLKGNKNDSIINNYFFLPNFADYLRFSSILVGDKYNFNDEYFQNSFFWIDIIYALEHKDTTLNKLAINMLQKVFIFLIKSKF